MRLLDHFLYDISSFLQGITRCERVSFQNHTDILEIMNVQNNLHVAIKKAFSHYHDSYHQSYKLAYQGKQQIVIKKDSLLDNITIEESLKQMLLEREHLKDKVTVLPVYSHDDLTYLTQSSLLKKLKTKQGIARNRLFIDSKVNVFELYLEWALEKEQYNTINLTDARYYIMPFLIKEHYTVAVVKLTKVIGKRMAHIQYYNSYAKNLTKSYQDTLKAYFKNRGFIPKFDNLSAYEQRDDHNCGVFIIYKAIEIVSKDLQAKEKLIPLRTDCIKTYQDWILRSRNTMAQILCSKGINVVLAISA